MNSQLLEPVALVGIACEFPGDIHSPADLWDALVQSRDLSSDIPAERTDLLSYCAHILNQDGGDLQANLIRRGYFLSTSSYDTFEPSFFGLSDGEASTIDPCHRLLMLKLVHLLEDAGYPLEKVRGSRTSVHIGQYSNDHMLASGQLELENRTRFHWLNTSINNASARLSYHFDLRGPSLTLDTACSSSLQAVHLAVQTLRGGEADMAICGGVNTVYTPDQLFNYSLFGPVSTDGRSRSFSMDANGYAKGQLDQICFS
ncbi:unnamed protein product [Rotaria sp. Silwood1]|nr:unnamed protein product [Rotaria sp. Silwood1]CAF3595650.1 unnamed protein product [Rotaria sp. Silwood1]CAF3905219.1 unnamed protein product [Rotaria sp. Silwood1]CAF3921069.1 unnamed protein product [Rotaria sp. Silwood1]CAF4816917.1 unnamed protein product [Rotaria sp. Silwood1]